MSEGQADEVVVGKCETGWQGLRLDRANRHGLVAGATGTGKTVTLQTLAEGFSRAGVPVFAADVKGDLSGIAAAGAPSPKLLARAAEIGVTLTPQAAPTLFWDLLGEQGHPVRTTLTELGPLLLSRLLELSEAQEGVITIAFTVADEQGLLLLDLDDLQSMLSHLAEHAQEIGAKYGNVTKASVGAIQRKLLGLRQQGATHLFGEPALRLDDLMRTDAQGRGYVSVLAADKLMTTPQLYAVFLLWLISELFESLPEVGDPEKPKLVLFFDEAHLLFTDAPKALLQRIEQVVRLVRSKGVGVYFVTQSPTDVPDSVLAQLGTRVQHALRAYTPKEQAGLQAAAQSFRPNPAFDTAQAIQGLEVGEALVSTLDERGAPTVVQKTKVRPPNSRIGPLTPQERAWTMTEDPVGAQYDQSVNRESAFELLRERAEAAQPPEPPRQPQARYAPEPREEPELRYEPQGRYEPEPRYAPPPRARPPARSSRGDTLSEALTKSVVRSVGSAIGGQMGRTIARGILGSLLRR